MLDTARSGQLGASRALQWPNRHAAAASLGRTCGRTGHSGSTRCRRGTAKRQTGFEPCSSRCDHGLHADLDAAVPSTSTTGCSSTRAALERLYRSSSDGLRPCLGFVPLLDPWQQGLFLVTLDDKPPKAKNKEKSPDYYANVGDAIRTLRDDVPKLFEEDLNYSIYREDIVFRDPRNTFAGMKNYQLIFWSLRFHGRLFFKKLYVEVKRIWQPEDGSIRMRWTVHGIPRVPWEAEGVFDGVSQYKLDSEGKIYEHAVDNVILRDPPMQGIGPLLAGLNLVPQQQPCPGAWFKDGGEPGLIGGCSSSWASHPELHHSLLAAVAVQPEEGLSVVPNDKDSQFVW